MERKKVSGIMLILLLISILTLAFNIQLVGADPRTWTVDDDGPADFSSIQEAINSSLVVDGDTIFVHSGTYYERVVVNKSVPLIGEEIAKPVIIATGPSPKVINGTYSTVRISANNVTISGFEIQNPIGDYGIFLNHSSNSIVSGNILNATFAIIVRGGSGNKISDNELSPTPYCVVDGLNLRNSDNNVVTGNCFGEYCHTAFTMSNSNHNYVAFNYISGHASLFPFTIGKSNNNSIVGNTIWGPGMPDHGGHVSFTESNGNVLYHNSFMSDGYPITIWIAYASVNNTWDDGYPSGGNYWSDQYHGDCADHYQGPGQNIPDSDGIVDLPYMIDANNTDRYPLMNPWPTPRARADPKTLAITIPPPGRINSNSFNIKVKNPDPDKAIWVVQCKYKWTGEEPRGVTVDPTVNLPQQVPAGGEISISVPNVTVTPYALNQGGKTFPLEITLTIRKDTEQFDINVDPAVELVATPVDPAVGGIWIPVDKFGLLTPYIGLTILLAVAVMTVAYVKKRKRRTGGP